MINSNNTVDLSLNRGDVAEPLRHQLMASNNSQSMRTAMAHQQNSIFLSICSNEQNQKHKSSGIIISEKFTPNTKDKKSFEIMVNTKERVKVQHLETPSKLQNNRWNFHSFCSISDSGKEKMPNNNNNNNNITINQNDSAFKDISCNVEKSEIVAAKVGNSNLEYLNNVLDYQQFANNSKETDKRTSPVYRTKDQEHAFRRIEDVHNYSKLNRYSYSNGSSNSSLHEDDDVEEEEECDDDDDDEVYYEVLDETLETYSFLDKQQQRSSKIKSNDLCFSNNNDNNRNLRTRDRTELASNQNIAMQPREADDASNMPIRPDHHARRPMNAFLIFCKRHRAIVKDRYKSFENRAITKILGDWWASLDVNEKKCYTSLAQQNKDAFFNANPNFKWYKLPAPPLRTLHTRPSNTDRLMDQEDTVLDFIPHHTHHTEDHIFKLADEAQMGDLSTLMCDKKLNSHNALQQALGETTQYLSIQIPDLESPSNKWPGLDVGYKRRLQNDNSFSSNSSEEDLLHKKTSRSCKGKIYQELVNSGQITAITKKPKLPKILLQQTNEQNMHFAADSVLPSHVESSITSECCDWRRDTTTKISDSLTKCSDKSKLTECSNSQTYELIQFNLEEKIKELPALNLDTYLQRKRNTKKKKKINSKKRNTSSSSKSPCAETTIPAMTLSPPINTPKDISLTNQAVGSRKRKARKESITRRDISTIENEVASLLPMQEDFSSIRCNDRYYYNDGQFTAAAPATGSLSSLSPNCSNACAIDCSPTVDQFSNFLTNINHNIASTSDLLILAEVAANRTEISN